MLRDAAGWLETQTVYGPNALLALFRSTSITTPVGEGADSRTLWPPPWKRGPFL